MQASQAEKQSDNSAVTAYQSDGRKGLSMPAIPFLQKQVPPPIQRKEDIEIIKDTPGPNLTPVQRVVVNVGYDGSATQSRYAATGNTLRTTGVANCIVIIAYDTGNRGAVMRHFDTAAINGGTAVDPISGGDAYLFTAASFNAVRNATRDELLQNIADANVAYKIVLGGIWADVDQDTALWKSRHNLITALSGAFGIQPEATGTAVNFTVADASIQIG